MEFNRSNLSRRYVLGALPALAGAVASPAAAEIATDPIFALIAEHDVAVAEFDRASIDADQLGGDPENAFLTAFTDAEEAVLEATPQTKAGALAQLKFTADWLLKYAGSEMTDATLQRIYTKLAGV